MTRGQPAIVPVAGALPFRDSTFDADFEVVSERRTEMPWWWPLRRVPAIEPSELSERLALGEPIQLIDVRTKTEYDSGHIPGATHLPIHSLPQRMGQLNLDPDRPVVTICKTAHRSIPATRLFADRGYNAAQLAHGMDRWIREGLPTTTQ